MGARRWRTTALIGATAVIATTVLAGCGAGKTDSGSAESNSDVAPAAGTAEQGAGRVTAQNAPAKAPDLSVDQRSIIYTGSITVRVRDKVNQAAAKAGAIAAAAGGFVGADKRSSSDGASEASLELRVPAAKFSSVVEELAGLGTEEQRGINTEDVTEQTIDLDARIATQQARVNSGRALLARAKDLDDLVMLEREVATRESDLASLNAKKRRLADLTALSTITAVLLSPEAKADGTDDDPAGFVGGLKGGWNALVASLAVLLTVLGALLPWLIALGLPVAAVAWLVRRFRRSSPSAFRAGAFPAPAFAGQGAGPLPHVGRRSATQPSRTQAPSSGDASPGQASPGQPFPGQPTPAADVAGQAPVVPERRDAGSPPDRPEGGY